MFSYQFRCISQKDRVYFDWNTILIDRNDKHGQNDNQNYSYDCPYSCFISLECEDQNSRHQNGYSWGRNNKVVEAWGKTVSTEEKDDWKS